MAVPEKYVWVPLTSAEYQVASKEGHTRAARFNTAPTRKSADQILTNNINGRLGEIAVLKWGRENLGAMAVTDVADDPGYDGDVLIGGRLQLEVKAAIEASKYVDADQLSRTAAAAYVWCRLPQASPPGIYLAGWTPTDIARQRARTPLPPLPRWYRQLGADQTVQDGDDFPGELTFTYSVDNTTFVNVVPRPMNELVEWLARELDKGRPPG